MTLGIIGTAGRGPDGDAFKANPRLWRSMCAVTQIVVTLLKPDRLVSGGAGFSDHLAVLAYLDGSVPHLTLHLPTEWTGYGFKETSSARDVGVTANECHHRFSLDRPTNSLHEIQLAIEKGATVKTGAGGFKARNTDIARESDVLLAFTFGNGSLLKGEDETPRRGGTLDTMDKWRARRSECETKGELHGLRAYHYCLNQLKLFSL